MQPHIESIRARLAKTVGQIAPKENHFFNDERQNLEKVINIYLPHLLSNPTIQLPTAVSQAINNLYTDLPALDNTRPITDDECLRTTIASSILMLFQDFHVRFASSSSSSSTHAPAAASASSSSSSSTSAPATVTEVSPEMLRRELLESTHTKLLWMLDNIDPAIDDFIYSLRPDITEVINLLVYLREHPEITIPVPVGEVIVNLYTALPKISTPPITDEDDRRLDNIVPHLIKLSKYYRDKVAASSSSLSSAPTATHATATGTGAAAGAGVATGTLAAAQTAPTA